jgi:hypothetical protein
MKLALCSIAIFLFFFGAAGARPAYSSAERQIFEELNQERQTAGLPALEWNELVAEAARSHSRLLAQNAELSHQFPGELLLPERLAATGARFTVSAENVARTEYLEDVHLALMGSSGHRANMLNPKYNAAGIGVVERDGKIYVTQDFIFLVPAYSEAEFSVAFTEELNQARKAKGIREIDARPDPFLHDLACSTDGSAQKLSDKVNGKYLVVFTSSEPHRLPDKMLKAASTPDYHRMNFGVCFRPDKEHGYANFWVVAAFSD